MLSADRIQAIEVEYARFNADRTLSSPASGAVEVRSLGGVLLLLDGARPKSAYTNRVLGLSEESLASLDAVLEQFERKAVAPRFDVRLENCTAAVMDELHQRGFRQEGELCYLAAGAGDAANAANAAAAHDVRRWISDQADAFLDLLESVGDGSIPAEIRSAKRRYYCTDRFRTFVAFVEDRPSAWATMFVTEDGKHGYLANAFTQPDLRGRGLQRALLLARLRDGADLGLAGMVTDVEPGTTSLRNCRRVGFQTESIHRIWTHRAEGA